MGGGRISGFWHKIFYSLWHGHLARVSISITMGDVPETLRVAMQAGEIALKPV